jgi:ribosome-binding factor A
MGVLRSFVRFSGFDGGMKARRCGPGRIGVWGGMANTRSYSAKGPSQRQLRVGELIRRTLSEILARGEVHDPSLNDMSITVGEVSVSVDLKVATVYVMPLLGGATVEQAIASLAKNAWELRKRVSAEMTLRHSPELRFRPDDTFDRLEEARRLFADPKVQADIAKPDDAAEGDKPAATEE